MKDVDSSVPCLSSSLLKSPSVSTNIKSDSVHCDPLSCVASGSRCHTADYLKEMKDVDSSVPCLYSSILKSPTVSTNLNNDIKSLYMSMTTCLCESTFAVIVNYTDNYFIICLINTGERTKVWPDELGTGFQDYVKLKL